MAVALAFIAFPHRAQKLFVKLVFVEVVVQTAPFVDLRSGIFARDDLHVYFAVLIKIEAEGLPRVTVPDQTVGAVGLQKFQRRAVLLQPEIRILFLGIVVKIREIFPVAGVVHQIISLVEVIRLRAFVIQGNIADCFPALDLDVVLAEFKLGPAFEASLVSRALQRLSRRFVQDRYFNDVRGAMSAEQRHGISYPFAVFEIVHDDRRIILFPAGGKKRAERQKQKYFFHMFP